MFGISDIWNLCTINEYIIRQYMSQKVQTSAAIEQGNQDVIALEVND